MNFEDLVFQFESPTRALHPYPPSTFEGLSFEQFGAPMLQDSARNALHNPHHFRGMPATPPSHSLAHPQPGKASPNSHDVFGNLMEDTAMPMSEDAYSPAASSEQSGEPELNQEASWRAPTPDVPHQRFRLTPFSENGTTTTLDTEDDEDGASEPYRKRKGRTETGARATKRAKMSDTSNNLGIDLNGGISSALGEALNEGSNTTPSDRKQDLRPTKPGYPYWGAEHSANPPPFVSTPIPRPEIGLHALIEPEGDERPGYNYTTLVKCAILGSPTKKLTIDEIYEQLMGKFEYYRKMDGKTDKGWKNSVRHHLSLSACFVKEEKKIWESGKGCWWTVDLNASDTDLKRTRKRKPRTKAYIAAQNALKQQGQEQQEREEADALDDMSAAFNETVSTQSTRSANMEESGKSSLQVPSMSNANRKLSIAALTGPSIFAVAPPARISGPPDLQDGSSREGLFIPASHNRTSGSFGHNPPLQQEASSTFKMTAAHVPLGGRDSLGHVFSSERTTATFHGYVQPPPRGEARWVSSMDWSSSSRDHDSSAGSE